MKKITDLITKFGAGALLGAATLDGYRRQVMSDNTSKKLNEINILREQLTVEERNMLDEQVAIQAKESSTQIKLNEIKENQKVYEDKLAKYQSDNSDYNKNELSKAKSDFSNSLDNLTKNGWSDYITEMIDKYYEFLSNLSPDKIVALFNIIMGVVAISSFFTVISIMLSEQVINRIKFLEKYPRIYKLLMLRNNINKSFNKFYLIMHITWIVLALLGNIFMFFI